MGQFCRRCNPKQRGPYPNIRANEHKWRPIGSNENMPWVVVTIPDELEKNGQPQNEKMKFESSKHETKLSGRLPTTGTYCLGTLPPCHPATPCLLYTSPSPRDVEESRMPSSA